MIHSKSILFVASVLFFFVSSCKHQEKKPILENTKITNESAALANFFESGGDFINSVSVPALVEADEVMSSIGNYLIVDIRQNADYESGHIDGAINLSMGKLLNYFDSLKTISTYEKIVIVCESGQASSYAAGILRLSGYGNVFALKYGMNAWSKSCKNVWGDGISNKYAKKLVNDSAPKPPKGNLPQINTQKSSVVEILNSQAQKTLDADFNQLSINADDLFANLNNYYIINFWPKEKYDFGHIPSSVCYVPTKDLKLSTDLTTLPTNKKILVYCFTGQSAAFVVAYLKMLGYDAYLLNLGANSFMHSILVSKEGWHGFIASEKIMDFPLVKGKNPSNINLESKTTSTTTTQKTTSTAKAPIKKAKKSVSGGCG